MENLKITPHAVNIVSWAEFNPSVKRFEMDLSCLEGKTFRIKMSYGYALYKINGIYRNSSNEESRVNFRVLNNEVLQDGNKIYPTTIVIYIERLGGFSDCRADFDSFEESIEYVIKKFYSGKILSVGEDQRSKDPRLTNYKF